MQISYLDELQSSVYQLAELAFIEDLPFGDITAEALDLKQSNSTGYVICRQDVSMAGCAWANVVLKAWLARQGQRSMSLEGLAADGSRLPKGSRLFKVEGPTDLVLGFERTFLNFLSRALGIANQTYQLVEMVRQTGTSTQVLDTRKTQPGYRFFDKYAVLCGGGQNHRMSLSDQVLIKENHIAKHAGVRQVLEFVKKRLKRPIKIEIEVQNLDECLQAIEAGCDIIMLDNFTPAQVSEACRFKPNHIQFEVSGGITQENILAYCKAGIDRISTGAITHSVIAPDITLLVEEELERERNN